MALISRPGARGPVETPTHERGRLTWYGCDLTEVAARFGTPCHVGSAEAVGAALRAFRAPFVAAGIPLEVRFSVKTNPAPIFLDAIRREGAGFEVVSSHELDMLQLLEVPGSNVLLSGLRGGVEEAVRAQRAGVRMVTLATPGQLAALLSDAAALPSPLSIALCICPGLWRGRWDLTLNTGARGSAVGFRPGSPELGEALRAIREAPRLRLAGLQMHLGSGIRKVAPYARGLAVLESVVREAAAQGHHIRVLDIGGGFGLSKAPVMGAWKTISTLFGWGRGAEDRRARSLLDDVAASVGRTLDRLARDGLEPERVLAEPGRAVAGPSQLLLLGVKEVAAWNRGRPALLCDGGAMAVSPMLVTEAHRVMAVVDRGKARRGYRVLGNLPTAMDRVSAHAELPAMHAGDAIAVLDTGAYFTSMNNTFAGPRPPIVWIENGRAALARRRETHAELMARDLFPRARNAEERFGT